MKKEQYDAFTRAVEQFFEREQINCLSASGEESYFSHRPCECCSRPLAGDRYEASGYNPHTNEVQTYEVCSDCLYFAEYGQLDDSTMLDMGT